MNILILIGTNVESSQLHKNSIIIYHSVTALYILVAIFTLFPYISLQIRMKIVNFFMNYFSTHPNCKDVKTTVDGLQLFHYKLDAIKVNSHSCVALNCLFFPTAFLAIESLSGVRKI